MPSRAQKKFRSLCGKWKERLWLGHWYVDFDYVDAVDQSDSPEGWESTASVKARSAYRNAQIQISASVAKDMSEANLNRTACHEMVHVALSPLTDVFQEVLRSLPLKQREAFDSWRWKESEAVTEHLTSVLLAAFKEKQSD